MNCSRCGAVLPDNAAFCTNCANPNPAAPAPPPMPGQPGSEQPYAPQGAYPSQGGYAPQGYAAPPPHVPDYLIWSILLTVCCCPLFGIISIVFSVMTMSDRNNGRYESAMKNSKTTKMMLIIGLVGGIVVNVILAIIQFMVAAQQAGALDNM